jgi:hypothetical protein
MINTARVGGIDFWRGAVLIGILVDHIPGNVLESLTPRNFGLSDSSEAFVFLSGLSVGIVYLPRARKHGLLAVARGCFQRALKLYGVHVALTFAAVVVFACAWRLSGVDDLIAAHGRSLVLDSPAEGLAGIALMSHQLGYFNILPLYIVLMLWAPLTLAIAMRSPSLALATSAGVYALSRMLDLDLPNWPQAGGWFFNPLVSSSEARWNSLYGAEPRALGLQRLDQSEVFEDSGMQRVGQRVHVLTELDQVVTYRMHRLASDRIAQSLLLLSRINRKQS